METYCITYISDGIREYTVSAKGCVAAVEAFHAAVGMFVATRIRIVSFAGNDNKPLWLRPKDHVLSEAR